MRYTDVGYNPPAPVSLVVIRTDPATRIADVPMLVDTGAEVSIVPLSVVISLGMKPVPDPHLKLASFDGTISAAEVVSIGIEFCDELFEGKYVVSDIPVGVIGRDILNEMRIEFNGPALEWNVISKQP